MVKRDDSTRSMGQASIGTDKPTRDKLKALAAKEGLDLSAYLRKLADGGGQGALPAFGSIAGRTRQHDEQELQRVLLQIQVLAEALEFTGLRRMLNAKACAGFLKYGLLNQAKTTLFAYTTELESRIELEKAKEAGQNLSFRVEGQ